MDDFVWLRLLKMAQRLLPLKMDGISDQSSSIFISEGIWAMDGGEMKGLLHQ